MFLMPCGGGLADHYVAAGDASPSSHPRGCINRMPWSYPALALLSRRIVQCNHQAGQTKIVSMINNVQHAWQASVPIRIVIHTVSMAP